MSGVAAACIGAHRLRDPNLRRLQPTLAARPGSVRFGESLVEPPRDQLGGCRGPIRIGRRVLAIVAGRPGNGPAQQAAPLG
ncbi:MAG: hypothetical protein EA400_10420 [Chromatiaceae bacterium]|nr:MAG: hypothetical protein EA400_10420 [Chromatiaceae bacterium]